MSNVTKMKKISLIDVVGQLRDLANAIEAGETEAEQMIVVVPGAEGEWPTVFQWGPGMIDYEIIGCLDVAKTRFLMHRNRRQS